MVAAAELSYRRPPVTRTRNAPQLCSNGRPMTARQPRQFARRPQHHNRRLPRGRRHPRMAPRVSQPCSAPGDADMTKHRGRGIASINYPIGMNLGGDPSQALVHSNPSGKFTVSLSSIDLGQGMKSVTRQICAETLGVPVEDVYVDTADSDTGPHCMGSFASRGTHRVGNAVMVAAKEAPGVMIEAAAAAPDG